MSTTNFMGAFLLLVEHFGSVSTIWIVSRFFDYLEYSRIYHKSTETGCTSGSWSRVRDDHRAEELLSHVGQTPSGSIPDAILPVMGALKSDQLLKHPDVDVKVSVASCLSEITRISAPETPYSDEIMKKMFQLYLMAFGKLSHSSGRCYSKALHILDSTAWVHSCSLMLDLEFGDIIVAMFQLFLATIRPSHPPSLFSNMEAIMTLTMEESDEVSSELLKFLLSSVEKENLNVSPISWKLGEKVLSNCAGILKAYLPEVMHSMSLNPRNYADVVATICQDASPKANVAEHHSTVVDSPKEIDQSADESSKSAMDKGSENRSSGNMLGSCHQSEHQTSTSQRVLSPTEMEQPALGAELPKKRERKPSSWLDLKQGIQRRELVSRDRKKIENNALSNENSKMCPEDVIAPHCCSNTS